MREIFLCASAFSAAMFAASTGLLDNSIEPVDKKEYQMIECDSLYENNYSINIDGQSFKAVGECFFGGYYPNEPVSEL